jgi:hypothetical protein
MRCGTVTIRGNDLAERRVLISQLAEKHHAGTMIPNGNNVYFEFTDPSKLCAFRDALTGFRVPCEAVLETLETQP